MNPPIPGHELISEGHTSPRWDGRSGILLGHNGGCRCGEKPDGFPNVSINEMKRWHRQHKAQLREDGGP